MAFENAGDGDGPDVAGLTAFLRVRATLRLRGTDARPRRFCFLIAAAIGVESSQSARYATNLA